MKLVKLLFIVLVCGAFLSSCTVYVEDDFVEEISLEEVISGYDLWYIDYHRTAGSGEIPFLSKAFTISFLNGRMYANNNIAGVGINGNGLGIQVGNYNTRHGFLATNHELDGSFEFEVYQISGNELRIYDAYENVTYYLIGYQGNHFDYDKLFYENIEYLLQEYIAWEKTATDGGIPNAFDTENYLQFTPENITTFYSSQDVFGTDIDMIRWDYAGDYQIYDVEGYIDLKILELYYDGGDIEEFELSVIRDNKIELFHLNSQTTYVFSGRGFIQYLKEETKEENSNSARNSGRIRTKVQRETKTRRSLK